MSGALSHLRILDMSRVLAGPWASQILADLGAEVIKIERPLLGDDTRHWGPPFLENGEGQEGETAAYFAAANRNKKSVTIDMTTQQGQSLIRHLSLKSDVVIENHKVGSLARYGLDYPSLAALKPELVYCSITGFGQDGPYANRAGYDAIIQAMSGLMSITGLPDGASGGGPMKVGVAVSDVFTGLYAVIGILAALSHKERTGEGQHIDLSLLDVQVAALANQAMNFLASGQPPERQGNGHPNIVPYQAFDTKDGQLMLAVGNDAQFARFCHIAGRAELSDDPRFTTNAGRVANRGLLTGLLQGLLKDKATDWWVRELTASGIPAGPINSIAESFEDAQVRHRDMKIAIKAADGTMVPGVASPLRLSATPPRYHSAPPALGAETDQVLEDLLGMSPAEISACRKAGVL